MPIVTSNCPRVCCKLLTIEPLAELSPMMKFPYVLTTAQASRWYSGNGLPG